MNSTIVTELVVDHQVYGTNTLTKMVNDIVQIALDIKEFVGQGFLNWVFIILLSIIAIMATIRTANIVSMVLVGLAALFIMFSWMDFGSPVMTYVKGAIALAAIVIFAAILKEGDRRTG